MSAGWEYFHAAAADGEVTIVGWDALCGECGAVSSSQPGATEEQIQALMDRWHDDHLTGRCGATR